MPLEHILAQIIRNVSISRMIDATFQEHWKVEMSNEAKFNALALRGTIALVRRPGTPAQLTHLPSAAPLQSPIC